MLDIYVHLCVYIYVCVYIYAVTGQHQPRLKSPPGHANE